MTRDAAINVFALATNTGREAIRNKVLYAILLLACLLTGTCAALGAVSIGDTTKFVKDFSLLSISLSGVITTVMLGVNLLSKELGKRTIYNILSKPVARWQFLIGKFVGLLATLVIMLAILTAALCILLYWLEGHADWDLLPVVGLMSLELALLLAVAIFFSSIVVTPALAGFFTAAVFIAGRSTPLLEWFFTDDQPISVQYAMRILYTVLPHLNHFYVADRIISGEILSPGYYVFAALYAAAYIGIVLTLSMMIFRRREFV